MHAPELSTAELVRRAAQGDQPSFTALYDRYARSVAAVVADRLRSPDDRADAVQDTFIRAWSKLDTLRDTEQFAPWLYAIARNAATSIGRRHARRAESELPDLPKTRQGVDALADRLNWRSATKFARRRAGKGGEAAAHYRRRLRQEIQRRHPLAADLADGLVATRLAESAHPPPAAVLEEIRALLAQPERAVRDEELVRYVARIEALLKERW